MTVRVDVDLSARTWNGLVIAGFESCSEPIEVGQHVLAVQSDDDVVADGVVERFDAFKKLVYVRVKWETLRDDEPAADYEAVVRFAGLVPCLALATPAIAVRFEPSATLIGA